ncbi:MAG: DHHA1 domain-containing protein [bacterium]|nr:DHHA1 domain-containing protein [bacterium]
MKKIIVFYHKNCWDGFGGAWAAWRKLGNKADYVGVQPGEAPGFSVKGREVYLIDTAFPEAEMRKILKNNNKLVVLDHHFSNREVVKISTERSYVMNHSGAVIAWNYFHPKKPVPVFLKYVEDADIWKWTMPHSKAISMLKEDLAFDFKVWSKIINEYENKKKLKAFMLQGQQLVSYSESLQDHAIGNAQVVKFEGRKCLAVNSPLLHSDIGNKLSKLMPPFGIVWSEKADYRAVSLRSNGKFDVSKLAQKYGGGGHKAAAAFRLELKDKLPWKFIKAFEKK